jgi:hypothetical protein
MITEMQLKELLDEQTKAFEKMLAPIFTENKKIKAELQVLSAKLAVFMGQEDELYDEIESVEDGDGNRGKFKPVVNRKARSYASKVALPASTPIDLRNRFIRLEDHKEHLLLTEKSKNCVLVGVPEMDTDKSTENADQTLLTTILLNAEVKEESVTDSFRHGESKLAKDGKKLPRILKIKTNSEETRELILRSFRSNRPDTLPSKVYMRRDYTQTELQVDWQLRQECHKRNTKAGLHQYIVRDLQIVELKKTPYRPYNASADKTSATAVKEK